MPSSAIIRGTTGLLEPLPAEWDFDEGVVATRRFTGPQADCLAAAPGRGASGSGLYAGMWVRKSKVTPIDSAESELVIVYEGAGSVTQLPPTEYEVRRDRQDMVIEKHPNFKEFFGGDTEEEIDLGQQRMEAIRCMLHNPPSSNATLHTDEQKAAMEIMEANEVCRKVYLKALQGRTHYACFPAQINITSHHLSLPTLDDGGKRWTPAQITAATGIDAVPNGVYLRGADSFAWTGTFWKVTANWTGAPEWDTDIYPAKVD